MWAKPAALPIFRTFLRHDDILFLEVSDTNVLFLERFLLPPAAPASLRLLVPIFLLHFPRSQPLPTIDFPPLSPGADGAGCTLHCSAGLEGGEWEHLVQLPPQRHPALLGTVMGNPVGTQLMQRCPVSARLSQIEPCEPLVFSTARAGHTTVLQGLAAAGNGQSSEPACTGGTYVDGTSHSSPSSIQGEHCPQN